MVRKNTKFVYVLLLIVGKFLVYLFNLLCDVVVWLYEFLFDYICILDSDIRRDIFIGVTGVMVAIVIFVAELVSNKRLELEKKLILHKTKIKEHVCFCIIILFMMLISSFFISSNQIDKCKLCYECDILYFIIQLVLNICIFIFMFNTVKLFFIAVKLNVDKKYFSEELDNYIYAKSIELEKSISNTRKKDLKSFKKKFDDYISDNKMLSVDTIYIGFEKKEYVPIFSNKRGLLKSYNYKKIDLIIDNIITSNLDSNEERILTDEPLFVFTKKIGVEIEKGENIGYYLKGYKNFFDDFNSIIIYDDSNIYVNDEINVITKEILDVAESSINDDDYDSNSKVFNYLDYLYKNKYNCLKESLLNQIKEKASMMYKDDVQNKKFIKFLNSIASLAYIYDNFEDYKSISEWIYLYYHQQLQFDNCDIRQVAYDFSNHYFKFDYFSIKKNTDIRYYDLLISKLLKFICDLIREKKLVGISILLKNILLEYQGYSSEDFTEKDIINFQFAIGIIFCIHLYIDNNKDEDIDKDKDMLLRIINWAKQYFLKLYEGWSVINNFKKYFNKSTCVQSIYNHIEIDFVDHKYLSSWSTYCVDQNLILKEFMSVFNIRCSFEEDINLDDITKDDLYYFKHLLAIFNSDDKTRFETCLDLKKYNGDFDNILNKAIQEAQKKEDEYVRSNQLSQQLIQNFEKKLRKFVLEYNELEEYLSRLTKIEHVTKKLSKVYGINQLVSRDLFFDKGIGSDTLAEQLSNVFQKSKEYSFMKKIDNISVISDKSVDDVILGLDNIEEYVLISNYINCCNLKNFNHADEIIEINDKKLDILRIAGCENVYLIEKKYLPKLQYCSFVEEFEENNIDNSLFYDFSDLSADESLRNEIIEKSSWLAEKGDLYEQHEYLRQQCRIRVYLAYRFLKVKNSKALKFENNSEK